MALNLFGGKVDHPMADAKQAQRRVAELPSDPAKAMQEITELLESITQTEGFRLDRRFENLDLLDGAAKNCQRKLAQEYLAVQRQQKFQENRLWTGVFGFWQHLGDAYIHCVHGHESNLGGATAIRKSMPVIVARALRCLTLQLKWVLLRYGLPDARIWNDLARLYALAEQKGYAATPIAIYPGAHGASTVQREFLKALMLSASSTDGLPPVKQEIAERAVAHFAEAFRLSGGPEGCTHCFDLALPKSPARLFKGAASNPTARFFGAGDALAGLEKLASQIAASGAIPSDVNLGGSYERDVVVSVLKHLAQQWSGKPPVRGSERRHTASRITVVPGLNDIIGVLDPASSDELDFSQRQAAPSAESWIVVNVSDGGYGAIIPPQKSDWIRVGTLVGVRSEVSTHWGVGLIRRISRDEHQQRQVGIQVLTRTAIPIRVSKSGTTASFNAGPEPQPAILLSTSPDKQGEVGVVLRDGLYDGRDSFDMTVKDRAYLLMPSSMVENGEDFDWAKFKVMQRSA